MPELTILLLLDEFFHVQSQCINKNLQNELQRVVTFLNRNEKRKSKQLVSVFYRVTPVIMGYNVVSEN